MTKLRRIILEFKPECELPESNDIRILSLIVRKKSYGVEVDLTTTDLENLLPDLKRKYGPESYREIEEPEPLVAPEMHDAVSVLKESMNLFSEERYWESHVSLEMVWRNSRGSLKQFLQGLIVIAASQVQFQMGRAEVAFRQYDRAMRMLNGNTISSELSLNIPESFTYPVYLSLNL